MRLIYYQGHRPNFGDELNWHLFESLFDVGDFAEQYPEHCLFGVGSILSPDYYQQLGARATAVLFGAGVRHPARPEVLPRLEPLFVRGPVSAAVYGCKYITDAAYLLTFMREFPDLLSASKSVEVALMPYYTHVAEVDWQQVARETGCRVVMPDWEPHVVLKALAGAKAVVSGAMHGCIAADILRIPWTRLRFPRHEDDDSVQQLKWQDWQWSLDLPELDALTMQTQNGKDPALRRCLTAELVRALHAYRARDRATLSADAVYTEKRKALAGAVRTFSERYGIRINQVRTRMEVV